MKTNGVCVSETGRGRERKRGREGDRERGKTGRARREDGREKNDTEVVRHER